LEYEAKVVRAALKATYEVNRENIPNRFIEEAQGLSDGTGISFNTIIEFAMIPELAIGGCSMYGAWGKATSQSLQGNLIQLRALDWAMGPYVKYPAVMVYHPNEGDGHSFSYMSFPGFLGAIDGYSSAGVGLSDKYWYHYNGSYSRIGNPWNFVLRDILQYDTNKEDAIARIYNTNRTCAFFLGIGDSKSMTFDIVEYSHE